MSDTRVRVSLTDGVLEFEGPEYFVSGLVEKFAGVIQTALAGDQPAADCVASSDDGRNRAGEAPKAAADVHSTADAPPSPERALSDMFAATQTGVQILRALPGSTKALRAVNLAKLYLYGLQKLKQRDTAYFAEIGRVCKAHGCFDPHNMAACLKAERTSFVFGGKGKRQTLKLSAPGMQETAALIAGGPVALIEAATWHRVAAVAEQGVFTWHRSHVTGRRPCCQGIRGLRTGNVEPSHGITAPARSPSRLRGSRATTDPLAPGRDTRRE